MVIESLLFRPIFGGTRNGLFTLELKLGASGPRFSNAELVGRILRAAGGHKPQTGLLLIRDFGSPNDPWEVTELIESLSDSFKIISHTAGIQKPGWVSLATTRRVSIAGSHWLRHKADEIFYVPEPESPFAEPDVGLVNIQSWRGMVLDKKVPGNKITDFLDSCKLPWFVLFRPIMTVEVQIL